MPTPRTQSYGGQQEFESDDSVEDEINTKVVVFRIDLGGGYTQYNGNKFKAKIGKTTQNSNYFPRSVNVHFGDNDMGK